MKDFLDSIILWEMIFLFWMAGTLGNRVFNFTSQPMPKFEQILPPAQQ